MATLSLAATQMLWDVVKRDADAYPLALRQQVNGQRAAVALSILETLGQLDAREISMDGVDSVRKNLFYFLNIEFPVVWP